MRRRACRQLRSNIGFSAHARGGNNWRHHREDRDHTSTLDPFSSAVCFGGWKELDGSPIGFRPPPTYASLIVWFPRTWLLATGWRKHGRIDAFDVPGGDE